LYAQALDMLQFMNSTRAMLRAQASAGQDVMAFAVPHSLAFTFFPGWGVEPARRIWPIKSRLIAFNVHDAVLHLIEGGCDR
jgi:hypothetical protein